ncbi:GNAT family N-acetyltransferase [Paractinoplanes atraurantiacus]|uniref:Ribosomal protein S18 acetylase RimI n=1 Tax=Paractinoplanes atraurantiacus TaxID=1036182 RepID=A0A285IQC5_9ACTN|nr:GNAT family N-acetyltransferase [Actinoplanes atraurantiacus]SNY50225.1 Ribosomal protein S18 acetylase RimI [Actinoplanes atraurantiacus]
MTIELVPFTRDDLDRRLPAMTAQFAAALAENHGFSAEEAARESERQTRAMLPDGVATEGQLLCKGMAGGTEVGFLWISLPGTTFATMAWISEIEVAEEHRSHGYGGAMLRAAEADLAARGVGRVGLHVFGDNTGARRLYRRLGYRLLTQIRARPATDAAGSVTLTPMTPEEYARRLDELIATDPMVLVRERPERARERAAELGPDGLHTAVAGGRPVGWIWITKPSPARPGIGTVLYVWVDEPYRRKGLGRELMAAAEATVARHGVPQIGLFVSASSHGAQEFADRLGFPVVSEQLVKDL